MKLSSLIIPVLFCLSVVAAGVYNFLLAKLVSKYEGFGKFAERRGIGAIIIRKNAPGVPEDFLMEYKILNRIVTFVFFPITLMLILVAELIL